jgi:hypothetical protein
VFAARPSLSAVDALPIAWRILWWGGTRAARAKRL